MNYRLKKRCCLLLAAVTIAMSAVNPVIAAEVEAVQKMETETVLQELETETAAQAQENEITEQEAFRESEEGLVSEAELNEAVLDVETELETEPNLEPVTVSDQKDVTLKKQKKSPSNYEESVCVTDGELENELELEQFKATAKDMGKIKINQQINGTFKRKSDDSLTYTFVAAKSGYYKIEFQSNYRLDIYVRGTNCQESTSGTNVVMNTFIAQNMSCTIKLQGDPRDEDVSSTVSYKIKVSESTSKKIEESKSVSSTLKNDSDRYYFIPNKTGTYDFVLSCGSDDIYVRELFDENGLIIDGIFSGSQSEKLFKDRKYFFSVGTVYQAPANGVKYKLQINGQKSYNSFTYSVHNNKATITGYVGSQNTITIPSSINGVAVNSIEESAFKNCTSLTSVTINADIKDLKSNTFYGCEKLKTIKLPSNLKKIGSYAFGNCASLKELYIPDTVTEIDVGAFSGCSNLTQINIPDSVTVLYGTFERCTKLKNITLPKTLKEIGYETFAFCSNLENITIPKSVSNIGREAFYGCIKLKSISLPDSLTNLEYDVFSYCSSLESVHIPEKVELRYNAFSYCSNLKNITVHKNNQQLMAKDGLLYVKEFYGGGYALITCPAGKTGKIALCEETQSINNDAFAGCDNIVEIILPASVDLHNMWYGDEFHELKGLKSIVVDKGNETAKSVEGVLYSNDGKILIWYPKSAAGKVKINNGVERLSYGLVNCSKITELVIPSTVTDMGSLCGCSALTKITVDSKNTTYKSVDGMVLSKDGKILYSVPAGKSGEVSIPKGVEEIDRTFNEGGKITKIVIPSSLENMPIFSNFTSLENISVDKNNKYFSSVDGVLYDKKQTRVLSCPSGIKTVKLVDTVTSIGYEAFSNCSKLSKVILPEKVELLELRSFINCGFDLYFTSDIIPAAGFIGAADPVFEGDKIPTGYYDSSSSRWKAAISTDGELFGIKWKAVKIAAASVKLNTLTLTMAVNATSTLKATVSNASNTTVTWSTSDKSVATVSSKGVVTAKSAGKATITAKCNGKSAKCIVTVNPAKPKLKKAASAEKGKIKITWEKAAGADGYIIYKKSGDNWKKLETVKSSVTSYTDKGLTSGKKYTYTVKAYKTVSGTTYTSDFDKNGVSAKVK